MLVSEAATDTGFILNLSPLLGQNGLFFRSLIPKHCSTLFILTIIMVMILPYIGVGLAGLLLLWLSNKLAALNRNIAAAKSSGLPYRISSKSLSLLLIFKFLTNSVIDGVPGYLWIATHDIFLGTLHKFTPSRNWLWPK